MLRFWSFTFLLFTQLLANCQDNPFIFSSLKEEDGLSNNVVNCFLKDKRGILWIGTYNGFSRFDGSNFYTYKKRKGNNSPANEVVHSLCEDGNGNIWAATDNGVFSYNPATDHYSNYNLKSLGISPNFYNILCDASGNIWAAGAWSVFKYNRAQYKFEELIKPGGNTDSLKSFVIRKNGLLADPAGKGLWMATSLGLVFYNTTTQAISNCHTQPHDSLFKKRNTSALSKSPSGNFWFFDNGQKTAISFDPVNRKVGQRIFIGTAMPLASGGTLFEDKNRRLWFSSWSYEMLVIDLAANNKIAKISNRPGDNRSIAGQFFWAGYQDADNTVWLGTISGISKCNPEKSLYKQYRIYEMIPELKNTSIVLAEEDPAGKNIWIITGTGLLIKYKAENGSYDKYDINKALPAASGLMPSAITGLKYFRESVIVTTLSGAWQLNNQSNRFIPFAFLPKEYSGFKCSEIVFNGDSVVYFNNGKEILYWNYLLDRKELVTFPEAFFAANARNYIASTMPGQSNRLWFILPGSYIGYLNSERKPERINIAPNTDVSNGTIVNLEQDSKGNIWILYKGIGLYCYYPATGETKKWDETDGLAGNRIHKIIVDKDDRVWCMLYNKVSVYSPVSNNFFNFKIPYSESNLDYYNHLSQLGNGNISGTINNEIVEFYPGRLLDVPSVAAPQISQLIAGGKIVSLFDGKSILLQPGDNTIRLRFGTLINKDIFPCDMEYKLKGAEDEWTLAGDKHEALYNNLNPGTYQFMVRVRGKNSSWQTSEAVVKFTIKAPFYKTTWFLAAIALLVAGILYFIYRYRIYQKEKMMNLENKANALEKEKALVMYEGLKQQLNPHFLFNSLTSLNSLIIADPKTASSFLDSLSKTYRYILKSRDSETVALGDELKFAENYVKLQQTRFEKGFDVKMDVPEEYHHNKIVPVTLQNLIENAIKHNIIDEDSPLLIEVYVADDYLIVQNNLQRKNFVETSNKQGLSNLLSLYSYLSSRSFEIKEENNLFIVKIPLI